MLIKLTFEPSPIFGKRIKLDQNKKGQKTAQLENFFGPSYFATALVDPRLLMKGKTCTGRTVNVVVFDREPWLERS